MPLATMPHRSREQQLSALARANEIRFRRARLKKALRAGHYTPATVLFSLQYDWLATMRVETVLLATPSLGRVKVARALNSCRISPSKTIQGMTDRQREELLSYLAKHYPQAEIGAVA
jgi:hypothetical protein